MSLYCLKWTDANTERGDYVLGIGSESLLTHYSRMNEWINENINTALTDISSTSLMVPSNDNKLIIKHRF